uniref:RxLR effector candidate protein n=1 Tax=Hyaloperonospora arabidopsidis (strain Emoy2) TaxID=559515 RepID=M4BQ02_HYAAE
MKLLALRCSLLLRTPLAARKQLVVRAFSGNWEYPKIEGSVADVTKALTTIGARLSISTAPLYFTPLKVDFIVREMKGVDELLQVQKTLLLCDAKMAYPSDFAAGSFFSACLKLDAAHVALEFLRQAENVRHYVKNQSFVRLAEHFDSQDDQEAVEELVQIMQSKRVPMTYKMATFRILNAKKRGAWEEAVALAKEAANDVQINSHLIIQLLLDDNGDVCKEHIPLARYLADKGDVYVNTRLADILAGGDGKLVEAKVEEPEESPEETIVKEKDADNK